MAATNINRVILTGNLTRDPELRSIPSSGNSVCSLRVACNTRRKDSSTGTGSTSPTTST
ncbi:MAG: single-stranded DNA-binding protein [Thermoleophilaceae bacterium]